MWLCLKLNREPPKFDLVNQFYFPLNLRSGGYTYTSFSDTPNNHIQLVIYIIPVYKSHCIPQSHDIKSLMIKFFFGKPLFKPFKPFKPRFHGHKNKIGITEITLIRLGNEVIEMLTKNYAGTPWPASQVLRETKRGGNMGCFTQPKASFT